MNRRRVLEALVAAVLVVVLLAVAVVAVPTLVGAEESYVVLSGSMEPSIGAGDVVIVDRVTPGQLERGDVAVFETDGRSEDPEPGRITHRVVEVVERDGSLAFRTKGDANEAADPTLRESSQVLGRVRFTIPYLGYLLTAGSPSLRIALFVVLPGVLLAGSGLWTLARAREGGVAGDGPEADEGSKAQREVESGTERSEHDSAAPGEET